MHEICYWEGYMDRTHIHTVSSYYCHNHDSIKGQTWPAFDTQSYTTVTTAASRHCSNDPCPPGRPCIGRSQLKAMLKGYQAMAFAVCLLPSQCSFHTRVLGQFIVEFKVAPKSESDDHKQLSTTRLVDMNYWPAKVQQSIKTYKNIRKHTKAIKIPSIAAWSQVWEAFGISWKFLKSHQY